MTPMKRLGLAMAMLMGGSAANASQPVDPLAPLPPGAPTAPPATQQSQTLRNGPSALSNQIAAIGRAFDGKAGIAVVSLRDGWEVGYQANRLYPQQSCSKLWVAITAMDAVDRGKISLNDRVTLGRDDLTLFHQPLAQKIMGGGHTTTLGALLLSAITESDNTANDKLMRVVGGPDAVRDMISNKGLGAIRFYNGERALQSKIAGLIWSQNYSIGDAFYKARSALPTSVRKASFDRYVADPYDGASPQAVARALARLKRGELLSPQSTNRLLSIMSQTRTGKLRVRAAVPSGWSWSHKTGTGQNFQGRIAGINDIGLLTAPDGTVYAMSIMSVSNKSDGSSQDMMQAVTRSVVAYHNSRR